MHNSKIFLKSIHILNKIMPMVLIIVLGINTGILIHIIKANQKDYNQIPALHEEIIAEFQQIKHLVRANTDQQIIYLKIMLLRPNIDADTGQKIATSVSRHSRAMKKDPDLILAIISVESHFNPEAISRAGAEGLMQIMPVWKKTVCSGYNLKEIDDNVKCGTRVYSLYEEQYKDMQIALTVYNRGPSVVDLALSNNRNPCNGYGTKVLGIYNRLRAIGEMNIEDF